MRKLLLPFAFLTIVYSSNAQCINFFEDTIEVCQNMPFTATGSPTSIITTVQEFVDFNNGFLPAGWSLNGGSNFSQTCGPGIDNTPYYWASTAGNSPYIQSPPYDFTGGGSLEFDMLYAVQGGAAPCEGPDLENEGVSILYSIDGGATWIEFIYYSPGGYSLPQNPGALGTGTVANGQTPYTVWNNFSVPIPPPAQTTSTIIRWEQFNSSGVCCDNWGVDNINVEAASQGISYVWNTGATGPTLTDSTPIDSTFVISVFDNNNALVCEDSVHVVIDGSGFDLGIQAIAGTFVQGQSNVIHFAAYNDGCPPQSGDVVIKLDPLLNFLNSTPAPDVITTDSLIYNYTNLYEGGVPLVIEMNVTTSQSAVVGDSIHVDAYVTPISGDANPIDNTKNYIFPVMASYDPNDKKVYPIGDCDVGYVPNNQLMTYTIRFQNTGNSDAINVRIRDVIDANLDVSTMRVVASSDNLYLDWVSSSEVDFKFDNIMLPPQSVSQTESIGYVVFEIEQVQGLAHGTQFTNQVDIFFDFNSPITTNMVLNTVTDGNHNPFGDTLFINAPSSYSWNGQILTSSGVYTQTFPLPDGCDSTAILLLTLESDVSLDELDQSAFNIYPNPAENQITVQGEDKGVLFLINSSGKAILEREIDKKESISLDQIANGVYVVEIHTSRGLYRKKLVIRK